MRDESAPEKLEARCGRRTSSPVDARVSSIFLVLPRRPMVSTGPPTVVEATRSVEERQDAGDGPSARLAGEFLPRGDGNPAQLAVRRRRVFCACVTGNNHARRRGGPAPAPFFRYRIPTRLTWTPSRPGVGARSRWLPGSYIYQPPPLTAAATSMHYESAQCNVMPKTKHAGLLYNVFRARRRHILLCMTTPK